MDNYTMIPNDLLEAMYSNRLSPLHMQIMLYVIRKTYGFHKETDFITITKLASDLGRYRQDVSEAVRELEGMGCLEVVRTRSRNGHQMRARPPHEWLAVGETRHVGKTLHEGNSRRNMSGNSDEKRRQNTTHKRKKETNQKKTVSRIGISDSYADGGDRSEFTEEENRRLDEDGWDDLSI